MQKKLLALLLTFCMVLTLAPISVFANSEEGGSTLSFGDAIDLAANGWTDTAVQTYRPLLMRGEILGLKNVQLYDASSDVEGLNTFDATTSFDIKVKIRASELNDSYTQPTNSEIKNATGLQFAVGVNQNGGWLKDFTASIDGVDTKLQARYNRYHKAVTTTWDGEFEEITYTFTYDAMKAHLGYVKAYNDTTGKYDIDMSEYYPAEDYSTADGFIAAGSGVLAIGASGLSYQNPSRYAPMDIAGIEVVKNYTVGEEAKEYTLFAWGDYSEDSWVDGITHEAVCLGGTATEYTNTTGTTTYAIGKTLTAGIYKVSGDFKALGGELALNAALAGYAADEAVTVDFDGANGDFFITVEEDTYVDALTLTWTGEASALAIGDAKLANAGINTAITGAGETIPFNVFPGATAVDADETNDMLYVNPALNYAMGFNATGLGELEAGKEYTVSFDVYSPITPHTNRRVRIDVGGKCVTPTWSASSSKWVAGYTYVTFNDGERASFTFTTSTTFDETVQEGATVTDVAGALSIIMIGTGGWSSAYNYAPYAIDNLTVVDNATGATVAAYDFEDGVPSNFARYNVMGDTVKVDGVNVTLEDVAASSVLSTITERDYLAVANGATAKLEGSTVSLAAGKYVVTGNFRSGEYTSANLTIQNYDANTHKNVTADYNGANIDLVVTYSDGTSITVAPAERVAGEFDTEYMNWTPLTYQFGDYEDKIVTAIEFLSSGYNAQTAATNVAFDMCDIELACVATFAPMDGDTIDLDAIADGATNKTVAANEYLHFGQNKTNSANLVFATMKDYLVAGVTYEISVDMRANDGYDMPMRWFLGHNTGNGANVALSLNNTIKAGEWTPVAPVTVTALASGNAAAAAGNLSFNGMYNANQISSIDIDNLVVKVTAVPEGFTDYTVGQIVLSTNEADKNETYYKSWAEVGKNGTVLSEATDYMTSDENTINYAMNTKLAAGAYKLSGTFRMADPDLEKVLCYFRVYNNTQYADTVKSRDGADVGDYNGVNLAAKVTYIDADGLKTIDVPATAAVRTHTNANGTVELSALAYTWTDVEFDFMLDTDVVITDVEIVSTGYDFVVDETTVVTRAAATGFNNLRILGDNGNGGASEYTAEDVSVTAVAEPFDVYGVKFEAVSDGIVLDEVGESADLDATAGEWTGMTEITAGANDYISFKRLERYNYTTNGFYTDLTFEAGQSYEVSLKIRSYDSESANHYIVLQGAGNNGADLKAAAYNLSSNGKWTTYTYNFTAVSAGTGYIYYYGMNPSNAMPWDFDDIVITKYTLGEDGTSKIYGDVVFSTLAADAEQSYYVDITTLELSATGTHASEVTSYMTSGETATDKVDNKLTYTFTDGAYAAAGNYKLVGMFRNTIYSRFRLITGIAPTLWGTYLDVNGTDIVAYVTLSDGTVLEVPAKFANEYTKDASGTMFTPVEFVFELDEMSKIVSVEFVGTGTKITAVGENTVPFTVNINNYDYKVGTGNYPIVMDTATTALADVTFEDVAEAFLACDIALECITEDEANEEFVCEKHLGAPVVVENEDAGNCQTLGSYDNVSYCQICGEEVSRTTITTEVLGDHSYVDGACKFCGKVDPSVEYTLDEIGESVVMDETNLEGVVKVTGDGNSYLVVSGNGNISSGLMANNLCDVEIGTVYTISYKVIAGTCDARSNFVVNGTDADGAAKKWESGHQYDLDLAPGQTFSFDFTPEANGKLRFDLYGAGTHVLPDFAIDDLTITVKTPAKDSELEEGTVVFEDNFDTLVEGRYTGKDVLGKVQKYIEYDVAANNEYYAVAEGNSAVFGYTVNLVEGRYALTAKVRDIAYTNNKVVKYTKADYDAAGGDDTEVNTTVVYYYGVYGDAATNIQIKENYNDVTVKAIVTFADGSVETFTADAVDAYAWTELTFNIDATAASAITNIEFVASGYNVVDGEFVAVDKAAFELCDAALTYTGEIPCVHEAGEAVIENEVAADCSNYGTWEEVVYCALCGEEMSRTPVTGTELGDHVAGEAVREKEIAATCTATGYYEEVVYCALCGDEMSRTQVVTEKIAHNFVDGACTVCYEPDPDAAPDYEVIEGFEVTDMTKGTAIVTAPATGWIIGENTFNIACDNVCRVYVTNDGVTYTTLTATANENGGYDFTTELTADSEIIVALYGDINLNGRILDNDYTLAKDIFLDSDYAAEQDALTMMMLDNNGDGKITVNEITLVKRALLGYDIAW